MDRKMAKALIFIKMEINILVIGLKTKRMEKVY
jgi:hypothetical protein